MATFAGIDVLIGQMAHLALLIGLVLTFKWELVGSLTILASALVFFGIADGVDFFLITALPAFIFLTLWAQRQRPQPK